MRVLQIFLAGSLLLTAVAPAAATISQEDAVARAQSAGFSLVSRAEPAATGNWDLWASKDGIPYEVSIDSKDGSLLQAIPLDPND